MTDRSDVFDECLSELVSPRLEGLGFRFDRSRTYRRLVSDRTAVEIVNFQLGQRRLEGRFTVNLGVLDQERSQEKGVELKRAYPYDCVFQDRIGCVLPPKIEFLKDVPYLGMIFGSHDKWWRFSADKEFTLRQVGEVCDKVIDYGVPWLESRSD
jgi:hypothetical protein